MLERVLSNPSLIDLTKTVESRPLERKAKDQTEKPRPRRRRIISSFGYSQSNLQKTCPYSPSSYLSPVSVSSHSPFAVASKDGKLCVRREKKITTHDGPHNSSQKEHYFLIAYRIFRPVSLTASETIPIVVIHGGPGIPSNYLYPLANVVPLRSLVFFDQLGCGQSDAPTDKSMYSIHLAVKDLNTLIQNLGLKRFHLYGHSFGGIVAFEYLKQVALQEALSGKKKDHECASVILSSSPSSIPVVERDSRKLLDRLLEKDGNKSTLADRFHKRHQCRTDSTPHPLADAYALKGKVWCETSDLAGYVAEPLPGDKTNTDMPPALVLRGEHDFISEECANRWASLFPHNDITLKTLSGCSHHGLLENEKMYGNVINEFLVSKER